MKIFISHKQEDKIQALEVQETLNSCDVKAYLDLLDDDISGNGEKLTQHIREKLRECSDVIVILSEKTKASWWVPFEIGMATEKDMPIASYLISYVQLPDYLKYWPRLKNQDDVLKYVKTRNKVSEEYMRLRSILESRSASPYISETQEFYRQLKQQLK